MDFALDGAATQANGLGRHLDGNEAGHR